MFAIVETIDIMDTLTTNQGKNIMNRYDTPEWKALQNAQNAPENVNIDILTITGFMNHEQFLAHVARYVKQ